MPTTYKHHTHCPRVTEFLNYPKVNLLSDRQFRLYALIVGRMMQRQTGKFYFDSQVIHQLAYRDRPPEYRPSLTETQGDLKAMKRLGLLWQHTQFDKMGLVRIRAKHLPDLLPFMVGEDEAARLMPDDLGEGVTGDEGDEGDDAGRPGSDPPVRNGKGKPLAPVDPYFVSKKIQAQAVGPRVVDQPYLSRSGSLDPGDPGVRKGNTVCDPPGDPPVLTATYVKSDPVGQSYVSRSGSPALTHSPSQKRHTTRNPVVRGWNTSCSEILIKIKNKRRLRKKERERVEEKRDKRGTGGEKGEGKQLARAESAAALPLSPAQLAPLTPAVSARQESDTHPQGSMAPPTSGKRVARVEEPTKGKRSRVVKVPLPDDFMPNAQAIFLIQHFQLNGVHEFMMFQAYNKARGVRMADWHQAYVAWLCRGAILHGKVPAYG